MNADDDRPPCTAEETHRRTFLARLTWILSGLIGAIMTLPAVAFVFAPIFRRPKHDWRVVGKLDAFKIGQTVLVRFEDPSPEDWAGVTATTAAWLRRIGESDFIAFSINCRHLGCPVRWVATAGLFMCPCHGGVYYSDGTVAGGPPPEPLDRYPVRVHDGEVQIDTEPVPLTTTPINASQNQLFD
jgi:quinol---cytochrome c reductase iron-sulfur subunit, bacillus type